MADVYAESNDKARGEVEGQQSDQEQTQQAKEDQSPGYNAVAPPNPFGPRPVLKTDVVSTASQPSSNQPVVIAPSRLGASPFLSKQPENDAKDEKNAEGHRSSILAPSRLGILNKSDVTSPSKMLIRPSALSAQVQNMKSNDLEKKEKENQESGDGEVVKKQKNDTDNPFLSNTDNSGGTENYFASAFSKNDKNTDSSTDAGGGKNEFIFGQNLTERVTGVSKSPESKSEGGFIFGQNLADRVIKFSQQSGDETNNKQEAVESNHGDNDSGEKEKDDGKNDTGADNESSDKTQTLEESARQFQAKHEKKLDCKEVELVTGEEGESNVLQASGKLFLFDAQNQNWVERGRGLLRLNDFRTPTPTEFQSRIIMRTQGCLRVILNTKIWPSMTVERASQKSIRITATDGDDGIKVFLIMTNPKDSDNILRAVDWRIQQLRIREDQERSKAAEKRKADPDESTDDTVNKKSRPSEESSAVPNIKREESDSSVVDPETDASSSSCCTSSSLTLRSESD